MNEEEAFHRDFQRKAQELGEKLDALQDPSLDPGDREPAIQQCLSDIDWLSKEVPSRSISTTAYDLRVYDRTLKELNDKIQRVRLLRAPKQKFVFRSSTPATSSKKGTSSAATSSSDKLVSSPKQKNAIPATSIDGNRNNANFNELSSQSLLYYNCSSNPLPNSHIFQAGKPIFLSSLSRCVLYLPLASLSLTAQDIQDCLLMCGPVEGATHITASTNTTMAVSTGQLRMHNCYDCVVYLRCSSRPIIEHCSNISFSPMPGLLSDFSSHNSVQNQWDKVDDFTWLKSDRSPHWQTLAPERTIQKDLWTKFSNPGPQWGVDQMLKAIQDASR